MPWWLVMLKLLLLVVTIGGCMVVQEILDRQQPQ